MSLGATRIAASNRIDQSLSDDGSVINWPSNEDFIVIVRLDAADYVSFRDYRLRWRNVTSGGSFANLDSIGELTFNADTMLIDGSAVLVEDRICSAHPTYTWADGEEVEGDGTGQLTFLAGTTSEIQYGIDCSNAISGSTYEFQIYDATYSQAIGTCLAQITVIGSSSSSKSSSSVSSSSSSSRSSVSSSSRSSSSRSSSSESSSSSSRRGKTYRFRADRRLRTFVAKA